MSHKFRRCSRAVCGVLAVAVVAALLPAAAEAGAIFLPGTLEDGKFVPNEAISQPHYSVRYSTITATVDNGYAATKVQETIAGPDEAVPSVCLIPLPEGADGRGVVIASGVPNKDQVILPGVKFLDADAAQKIYETLAQGLDSSKILALSGRPALLVPKYELNGRVEIVVQFRQRVRDNAGVWTLACPMPATQWSAGPVARVSVAVTVGSKDRKPLRAMFSPTHTAEVERDGLYEAVVRVKTDNYSGTDDFQLCWVADQGDLGLRVLAHREEGDDEGYFMLLGNPSGGARGQQGLAKDVVFVLDTSGSMRGEKVEQARVAIEYCLAHLNAGDRFNIVTFGTEVLSFRDDPVAHSPQTVTDAEEFIESVVAKGRTNISGALEKALAGSPDQTRPRITIFLTDGTPTAGELVPEKIVESVKAMQPCPTRVFVMGVGHDVNAHLLDQIAELTDGSSEYVKPEEEIDAKVAALYDRLSHPVLTDVAIDCGELKTISIYPKKIPALFKGSEVMVFGRYRGGGKHTFRISGTLAGQAAEYACVADLPEQVAGEVNEFVAPLWASRKIGYLLQEMRLHGEDEELIAEVVRLSKKFGIVTEYTEFLAWAGSEVTGDVALNEARARMNVANGLQAGHWAVNQAFNDKNLQYRTVATQEGNNYIDRRGNMVTNGSVRQVGSQALYLRDGQWVDGEEAGDRKTRVVQLHSDEFNDLVRNNRRFAEAQKLGWALSLNVGDERIVVEKNGRQQDAELQEQFRAEQSLRMQDMGRFQMEINQLDNVELRNQLQAEPRFQEFRGQQEKFNQLDNRLQIQQAPNGRQFNDLDFNQIRQLQQIPELNQIPDQLRNVAPREDN